MRAKKWSIKKRILVGFMSLIIGITVVISVLFLHTRKTMQEEHMERIHNSIENVANSVDELVWKVYSVSDSFVNHPELNEFLEREYNEPGDDMLKKADTIKLYNQIISSYDFLQRREKMGGIYTEKGVFFNFVDANWDGFEVIEQLQELGVNSKDHLMRFYWYPLQDNFLISMPFHDVRRDKIILGARRVFSVQKSDYVCTQIFAIPEQAFYDAYKDSFMESSGEIYVLTEQGDLISSSNEQCVEEGALETEMKRVILNRTENDFLWGKMQVCVRRANLNGWLVVAVIPRERITGDIDLLYWRIFLAVTFCMLFCCGMLLYLYSRFIIPVNDLNMAMMEVYSGNLNAYMEENGKYEIADMMHYFNVMLKSINVHVIEKLESDRKEKELELEVLMGQINPHFLYNTLENIVWKSSEAGCPDIGRMAASLGRMYRLSIGNGQIIVSMQQEIEHLMAYVKIQKNRYEDAFDFDLRTDPEKGRKYYVLKILLQPVVENSFLYGMEGLERKMIIRVTMKEREDRLEIRVIDNGIGMGRDRLCEVRKQIQNGKLQGEGERNRRSTGIGLHNVAERLRLHFDIEEPVRIYSKYGMGTLTVIELPLLTAADVEENGELKKSMIKSQS